MAWSPRAVVSPGSVEEVSKLLAYAKAEKLAVVPRGNGTKMADGGIPRKLDVVLSMLQDQPDHRARRPQPEPLRGGGDHPDGGAEKTGRRRARGRSCPWIRPIRKRPPSAGIIATNGSGPRRYLYNTARDLLLGLKAVLPNGDIVAFGGKTVKNVSGYDMTKLMIGSWGALGVITEITTKLLPLPEASATLLVSFDDLAKAGVPDEEGPPFGPSSLGDGADGREGRGSARREGDDTWSPSAWRGSGRPSSGRLRRSGRWRKKEGAIDAKVLEGPMRTEPSGSGFAISPLPRRPPVILRSNFVISKQAEILGNYEKMAQAAGVECAFIGHAGNGILRTLCPGDAALRRRRRSSI